MGVSAVLKKFFMGAMTIAILTGMAGCGLVQQDNGQKGEEAIQECFSYCVPKEECFLCGGGLDHVYWECLGQNNVGLISLNSFDLLPVEINRYDSNGEIIGENVGYTKVQRYSVQDDGFSVYMTVSPDRGVGEAIIALNDDKELKLEKTAHYLCTDHFRELTTKLRDDSYGLGIIDLYGAKIYPMNDNIISFLAGDYYIYCDQKTDNRSKENQDMKIIIAFTPPRYDLNEN